MDSEDEDEDDGADGKQGNGSDVEILAGTTHANGTGNGGSRGPTVRSRAGRNVKRLRTDGAGTGGGGGDEIIVIDE